MTSQTPGPHPGSYPGPLSSFRPSSGDAKTNSAVCVGLPPPWGECRGGAAVVHRFFRKNQTQYCGNTPDSPKKALCLLLAYALKRL